MWACMDCYKTKPTIRAEVALTLRTFFNLHTLVAMTIVADNTNDLITTVQNNETEV